MENRLRNLKAKMQKGELANFEFTTGMKQSVLEAVQSGRKGKNYCKRFVHTIVSAVLIVLVFGGMYQYFLVQNADNSNTKTHEKPPAVVEDPDDFEEPMPEIVDVPEDNEVPVIDDDSDEEEQDDNSIPPPPAVAEVPDFVDLLKKYDEAYTSLFANADANTFKFKDFKTKEEFIQKLTDMGYATQGFNEWLFGNRYLVEGTDGLYLEPQIKPIYFDPRYPYDVKKLSDTAYELSQVTTTDLYGQNYGQQVTFEYIDGEWLISSMITTNLKGTNGEPDFPAIIMLFDNKVSWLLNPVQYDANYKFKNIKTKQEFFQQLTDLASIAYLEQHFDGLIVEKPDGLYVVPQDYHRLYDYMNPHENETQKLSETQYLFTQTVTTELGKQKQTVIFELQDGVWKLTGPIDG